MRHLSNKEKKQLQEQLPEGYEFSKKDTIKEDQDVLIKNDEKVLIRTEQGLIPHLRSLPEDLLPSVYVDKGAIPHIANGADLMRPGIHSIDERSFPADSLIVIRDLEKQRAIAIGKTMHAREEMVEQTSGKAIMILHYVGDQYY